MTKPDKAMLELRITMNYVVGRATIKELKNTLIAAATHLADNGLLSDTTDADLLRWDATVKQL